ncbi:hypothetical protein NC99_43550 [Sunxiuqinia dokdonensis]|uniref:Uncharacterized protein n=1 Tax=Sunxiuqinia dokdonensis TaxID=1409788 RepID=A0A0L8V358_9BACT|nr:hypothetical protein NC99_43550 [Sunxiuqinia dokdonensis]
MINKPRNHNRILFSFEVSFFVPLKIQKITDRTGELFNGFASSCDFRFKWLKS